MNRPAPIHRIATAALALAAAVSIPASAHTEADDQTKSVTLSTADGGEAGTATFRQALHGVIIVLDLKNLTPGPHGLHIHETGACAPDFKAAGGHYNPTGAEHGFDTEGGFHIGDLPNITIAADGSARGEVFVPQVSLSGPVDERYPHTLRDADGSAIMIDAGGDDYRDMASSGDRVACGVINPKGG